MVRNARRVASLLFTVVLAAQAACASTPTATPQPAASATAPPTSATAVVTRAPTPTPAPATATPAPTAAATAIATRAAGGRPIIPQSPLPTPLPEGWPPPRPTVAAIASPFPTPCPPEAAFLVYSLVVTPDEPPLYYLVHNWRLYRSADRGGTWSAASLTGLPVDAHLLQVTVDYRHPETMYAVAHEGIYRRQGEGAWELVNTLYARTLAVDLQNSSVLWAGVFWKSDTDAVIVKSEDGGRTWGKADYGIELGGVVEQILVDPKNPNVLWALVGPRYSGQAPRLYRGGRDGHWEPLDLGAFQPGAGGDYCYPHGIAYDPNAGLLYVGCAPSRPTDRAMLLRSPNADAADSSTIRWEAVTSTLPEAAQQVGYVRPLAVDAREPRSLLALASFWEVITCPRYALVVSHDDGATWEALQLGALPQVPGQ
mgnify:FL=1